MSEASDEALCRSTATLKSPSRRSDQGGRLERLVLFADSSWDSVLGETGRLTAIAVGIIDLIFTFETYCTIDGAGDERERGSRYNPHGQLYHQSAEKWLPLSKMSMNALTIKTPCGQEGKGDFTLELCSVKRSLTMSLCVSVGMSRL